MSPWATKFEKAIFSLKVKVKSTRFLTLVLFERAYKWNMHAKYEVSISYCSKVKAKVNNRQINRQDKNNMPRLFDSGYKLGITRL